MGQARMLGEGIPGGRNSESKGLEMGALELGRLCRAGSEMKAVSFFHAVLQAWPHRPVAIFKAALNHRLGLELSGSSVFPLSPGEGVLEGPFRKDGAAQGPRIIINPHLPGCCRHEWPSGASAPWKRGLCDLAGLRGAGQRPPGHLFFRLGPNTEAIQRSRPVSLHLPGPRPEQMAGCHPTLEAGEP